MSTIAHFILPISYSPLLFQIAHFPSHIPSSHSYLYSILFLTLLYILPLFTQGCVCLSRFRLFCFCLCIYDLVFLFCCLFVIFVIWFSCCCWCSFVLQEQHVISQYSHILLLVNKDIQGNISADWIPRLPNQPSSKCKNTLQTICRAF